MKKAREGDEHKVYVIRMVPICVVYISRMNACDWLDHDHVEVKTNEDLEMMREGFVR